MAKFNAAVVQACSVGDGTAATVEKAVRLIEECSKQGASIAVFPEAYLGGYPKGASFNIFVGARTSEGRDEFNAYYKQAIDVPGPETRAIGKAVKAAKLFLTIGVIERDGGTLYCTALFFHPNGDLLGKHRKTMPTAAERLCWGFGDGSTLTTIDTPWGKMGAVICWENYMPLLRMSMYGRGYPSTARRQPTTATVGHRRCRTLRSKADASSCPRASISPIGISLTP